MGFGHMVNTHSGSVGPPPGRPHSAACSRLPRHPTCHRAQRVLQAHTYSRMPAQSKRALVLLERALALDPSYGLAHAYAAECHHSIFLRDGMGEEHRAASMRHAEAAITCGQDDATAALPSAWRGGTAQHCHYLNRRYPLVLLRRIHIFAGVSFLRLADRRTRYLMG